MLVRMWRTVPPTLLVGVQNDTATPHNGFLAIFKLKMDLPCQYQVIPHSWASISEKGKLISLGNLYLHVLSNFTQTANNLKQLQCPSVVKKTPNGRPVPWCAAQQ